MATNKKDLEMKIEDIVRRIVSEKLEFGNVARPKPTKASTATPASWKKEETPKPSSATQGSWDVTDTPGGISSYAKKRWSPDQIAAVITEVYNRIEFGNKPVPYPDKISASTPASRNEERKPKISASTQASWKKEEEPAKKVSASTQASWKSF